MNDAVDRARTIQAEAADPARSVVLSAAAGAGKTKVLVDRYLRLCLAGEGPDLDPRAILAITFTRKATIEIQARLQAQARRLVGLPTVERAAALGALLDRAPLRAELDRAGWFHETLLEDAAGLGIETMHAFCQRILGRFAAEAGLDPRFTVLDDQDERRYRTEALDNLELELAQDPAAAAACASLAGGHGGVRDRLGGFFGRRLYLQRWLDRVCPPAAGAAAALNRPLAPCYRALAADLQDGLFAGTPLAGADDPTPALLAPALRDTLDDFLATGLTAIATANDAEPTAALAEQLAGWRLACNRARDRLVRDPAAIIETAAELGEVLLTRDGKLRAVRGRRATRPQREAAYVRAVEPILSLIQQLDLFELLADNRILLRFGLRALDLHTAIKRRDRVVDFQDLEYLALRLLVDPQQGPHVHYRLDARLDHVLLDEFQDTNRNQWDLLAPLIAEILDSAERARTVLVVGDVKQSIYGFRGAEPAVFGVAGEVIKARVGTDAARELPTNFRSLPVIVETVGALCRQPPLADQLGEAAAGAGQAVARAVAPGAFVCVQPFAAADDQSGHQRAAAAVAGLIRQLVDEGAEIWDREPGGDRERPRSVRYADILVLTRYKTRLPIYETALRQAGIPFTPAGRGLLARCREVQDVLALLRWLTYPADDIAGAVVLRSPICRLPEARVQALLAARGAGRPGVRRRSLREVLVSADDPVITPVAERLQGWFRRASLPSLHDLLRELYREGALLERFEIAQGEQARFNLMRLLDLALAAEQRGGSLRDFVDELELAARLGGQEEGAQPAEAGAGRVRVMTVHAAKGLQAPVVILADAASPLRDRTSDLLLAEPHRDGPWASGVARKHHEGAARQDGGNLPGPLAAFGRQALSRLLAEEAHLLYVALTRAQDRLFVIGGRNDRQTDAQTERSYLGWLRQADEAAGGTAIFWRDADEFLRGLPVVNADADAGHGSTAADRAARAAGRLTIWKPPPLGPRFEMAPPSQLEDDRQPAAADDDEPTASGEDQQRPLTGRRRDNAATRRGTRVHAWLEQACRLQDMPSPPPSGGHHVELHAESQPEWEEARAVWQDPQLAWIFAPDSGARRGFAEVEVLHRLPNPGREQRRLGVIDRLVVQPHRVDIVDYKTNRITPAQVDETADVYRPQLLAYRDALAALYPGRELHCWLLWTAPDMRSARLKEVTP